MGMKFLNKKGWHTGSLRNIENVWKAEQKHEAEQKKLEELRKQIHEERERNEFRQLQEQAGLVPRQERLEFLYDSGLAVGKGSSSGFNALESLPKTVDPGTAAAPSGSSAKPQSAVPGSLFEEKPQSSNDTWRKLHSDPLLMIRQREQEALARVKNNPVKMAMIHKSVEAIKHKDKKEKDESRNKHQDKKSRRHEKDESRNKHQDKESRHHHRKSKRSRNSSPGVLSGSDGDLSEGDYRGKKESYKDNRFKERKPTLSRDPEGVNDIGRQKSKSRHDNLEVEKYERKTRNDLPPKHESRYNGDLSDGDYRGKRVSYKDDRFEGRKPSLSRDPEEDNDIGRQKSKSRHDNLEVEKYERKTRSDLPPKPESRYNSRKPVRLTEEERAARLREMQRDAEVHEEQRWKRIKKAEEKDAKEDIPVGLSGGRNFLDAAQRSVYGAVKGGSSTIEESVRRRTHYLQGRSEATEGNAFRR